MTPRELATEHVAWARDHGHDPADIMAALGFTAPAPSWLDVEIALERAVIALRRALHAGSMRRAA